MNKKIEISPVAFSTARIGSVVIVSQVLGYSGRRLLLQALQDRLRMTTGERDRNLEVLVNAEHDFPSLLLFFLLQSVHYCQTSFFR